MNPRHAVLLALLAGCSQAQSTGSKGPVFVDSGDSAALDSAGETGDSGETDTGETGATDTGPADTGSTDTGTTAPPDFDGDGIPDAEDFCPVYASWGNAGDGSVANPLPTIQEAVDLAGSSGCNEARAFQGTYFENVDWHGWPVNAESVSGAGTTTIDGQALDSVVAFRTGETDAARLYGFTLTNGGGDAGAGIYIEGASPVVEGNVITGNATNAYNHLGGGIFTTDGSPTIVSNEISDNDAGYGGDENGCDGGGINIRRGAPYIADNRIVDNSAGDGGGIWTAYSDAIIVRNVISGNVAVDADLEAGGQGGGINVQIAGPTETYIAANVISDNVAGMFGGGAVTYEDNASYGEARFENNVFAFNEVLDTDNGAGFCQWRRTEPTLVNNLVYGNHGVGVFSEDGIDASVTYTGVYANVTDWDGLTGSGAGTLTADPLFVGATDDGDWTDDDFRLQRGSPAVDAGDPAISDADGSRSDLGAYGGTSAP
jgi:hypothetical protein